MCLRREREPAKQNDEVASKHRKTGGGDSFSFPSCSSSGLPLNNNQNENQSTVDVLIDSQDFFPPVNGCNDDDIFPT